MLVSNTGKKPHTVCVAGAYGMGSCGDEAMLGAVISALRSEYPDCELTVISHSPQKTAKTYGVSSVYTFDLAGITKTLKKCRALIFGGGSVLQTSSSRRSLYYYLWLMKLAKRHGNSVIFYGCGFGPIENKRDLSRCVQAINSRADVFCARDRLCFDTLISLGVDKEKLVLSADPALTLTPAGDNEVSAYLAENGVDTCEKTVLFCVKDGAKPAEVKSETARLSGMGYKIIFAIVNSADAAITKSLSDGFPVIDCTEDFPLLAGVLKKTSLCVSMRLHALVAAVTAGTAFVAVGDDPKLTGFAEYAGGAFISSFSELKSLPAITQSDLMKLKAAEAKNLSAAAQYIEKENE